MKISVIMPAAGMGKRFEAGVRAAAGGGVTVGEAMFRADEDLSKSKLERELSGRPVFIRSVERMCRRPEVEELILAVAPDEVEAFGFKYADRLAAFPVKIVAGGEKERWETVMRGLEAVSELATHVAVHDAARPLVSDALVGRVVEAAKYQGYRAVIPGLSVSATLKRTEEVSVDRDVIGGGKADTSREGHDPIAAIFGDDEETAPRPLAEAEKIRRVTETVDRREVIEVQTPQLFERALLVEAYAQIAAGKVDPSVITDDAGLVEAMGETVYVVGGEVTNLKITRPDDLDLARAIVTTLGKDAEMKSAAERLFVDDDDED